MPHGFFNVSPAEYARAVELAGEALGLDRKSTRLNSSHTS